MKQRYELRMKNEEKEEKTEGKKNSWEGIIHEEWEEHILQFCGISSSYSYSCVSKVNHLFQDQNQFAFPFHGHGLSF